MIHRSGKAAAKGLNQTIDELDAEVKRLRAEVANLKQRATKAIENGGVVSLTFIKTDHDNLVKICDDLGVSLETFVLGAINRRIQDANDFRAYAALKGCPHLAAGEARVCVLCGEALNS